MKGTRHCIVTKHPRPQCQLDDDGILSLQEVIQMRKQASKSPQTFIAETKRRKLNNHVSVERRTIPVTSLPGGIHESSQNHSRQEVVDHLQDCREEIMVCGTGISELLYPTVPVPSLSGLPREMFCHIVSYIGPASTALAVLASVNRNSRSLMDGISETMLVQARTSFRVPLAPRHALESSTSLFVRHAQVCDRVNQATAQIDSIVRGKICFPVLPRPQMPGCCLNHATPLLNHPTPFLSTSGSTITSVLPSPASPCPVKFITNDEMDQGLHLALNLLGSSSADQQFLPLDMLPLRLERRVLAVCGKFAGMIFKCMKLRRLLNHRHHPEHTGTLQQGQEVPAEEEDTTARYDPTSNRGDKDDEDRLNESQLVMQLVVFRDWQLVKKLLTDIDDGEENNFGTKRFTN
eukprot:scaffold13837_cov55-Attheya_sp.AAC.1